MTDKDIIKNLEIIEADLRATRKRLRRQGWHSQLSLKTIYLVSDICVEINNRQDAVDAKRTILSDMIASGAVKEKARERLCERLCTCLCARCKAQSPHFSIHCPSDACRRGNETMEEAEKAGII